MRGEGEAVRARRPVSKARPIVYRLSFGHTGSSTIVPSALSYLLPNIGAPVISQPEQLEPDLDLGVDLADGEVGMLPTTEAVAPTHARLMKSVGDMWMLYSVPTMWRATLVIASSRSDWKVTSQPQ